jgi:hypothetical protein
MEFKWNKGALENVVEGIRRATQESCDVVYAEHSGEDIAVVRSALKQEFKSRFAKGAGPDEKMTSMLAERISNGERVVVT